MWTTVPPAKSIPLMPASGFSGPHMKPVPPHTMWAKGKYTANIQITTKAMMAENFIRSAMAPMISAGVMIAKVSWNIAQILSEIHSNPAPVAPGSTPLNIAKLRSPMNAFPGPNERL